METQSAREYSGACFHIHLLFSSALAEEAKRFSHHELSAIESPVDTRVDEHLHRKKWEYNPVHEWMLVMPAIADADYTEVGAVASRA